jgi:hypothetical protein
MIHDKPHFVGFCSVTKTFVVGTACSVVALLEVDFAFTVELAWGNTWIEVGVLGIDLLFDHEDFANEDLSGW